MGTFEGHETLALGCPDNTIFLSLQAPMDLVDVMARMLDNVRSTPLPELHPGKHWPPTNACAPSAR